MSRPNAIRALAPDERPPGPTDPIHVSEQPPAGVPEPATAGASRLIARGGPSTAEETDALWRHWRLFVEQARAAQDTLKLLSPNVGRTVMLQPLSALELEAVTFLTTIRNLQTRCGRVRR